MGLELNPYNTCVAIENTNGKQCRIAWYVDETKSLHVDNQVVSPLIEKVEEGSEEDSHMWEGTQGALEFQERSRYPEWDLI
jgi:hypothetical protein